MQLTETPEREMSSLQQNSYWAAPTRRTMERLRSQRPFVKKEKEYLPTRQQRTKKFPEAVSPLPHSSYETHETFISPGRNETKSRGIRYRQSCSNDRLNTLRRHSRTPQITYEKAPTSSATLMKGRYSATETTFKLLPTGHLMADDISNTT